jgi:hypothetical protein
MVSSIFRPEIFVNKLLLVTEVPRLVHLGIYKLLSDLHPLNIDIPLIIVHSGSEILDKDMLFVKQAELYIATQDGSIIEVKPEQEPKFENTVEFPPVIFKHEFKFTLVRPVQFAKTRPGKFVQEGNIAEVKDLQT